MENEETKNENEHTYDNGFHPKEVKLKDTYVFYRHDFFFRLINRIIFWLTKFFLFFPKKLVWGYRIIGKKNIKKQKGFLLISNHTHQLDALIISTSLPWKKLYITTLQSNMGFGIISKYFRCGGAVPIPEDIKLFKKFNKETTETLNKGHNILVYPEAALMPYCDHIRSFKPGAFHFALDAKATIIPSVITYHKPKGLYKLTRRKKPCMRYNILPPYTLKDYGNRRITLETAAKELQKIMSDYFEAHSDYFK